MLNKSEHQAKRAIRRGWLSRRDVQRGTCIWGFPTRRGSASRLPALSVPNVSRAKPRTEWCRAKSRGSRVQRGICFLGFWPQVPSVCRKSAPDNAHRSDYWQGQIDSDESPDRGPGHQRENRE